jgi:hypothetical protein
MRRVILGALALSLVAVVVLAMALVQTDDELERSRKNASLLEKQLGAAASEQAKLDTTSEEMAARLKRLEEIRDRTEEDLAFYRGRYFDMSCLGGSAKSKQSSMIGHSLRGDVDGDGITDKAFVVGQRTGQDLCVYLLRVSSGSTTYETEIVFERALEPHGVIRPTYLAEVDGRPGLEVIVDVHHGAAVSFAQMFTIVDGELRQIVRSDEPASYPFGYAGSLGAGNAVDCLPNDAGMIVFSGYERAPDGYGYNVSRKFYQARGAQHVLTDTEEYYSKRFPKLPEYRKSPLGSCSGLVRAFPKG